MASFVHRVFFHRNSFTQALYDQAKKDGWFVISMKNDWKRIFSFEN